jgi:hypothetical protein
MSLDSSLTKEPDQISKVNSFEYAALNNKARNVVQQRTSEIKSLMRRTVQNIIEIGEKLIEVKHRLEHGHFGNWLKAEFDWDERTARRFMSVSQAFKSDNLTDLPITASALYVLAAPSSPEEARIKALELAKKGEKITYSQAKNLVSGYKKLTKPKTAEREFSSAVEKLESTITEAVSTTQLPTSNLPESQPESQTIDVAVDVISGEPEKPRAETSNFLSHEQLNSQFSAQQIKDIRDIQMAKQEKESSFPESEKISLRILNVELKETELSNSTTVTIQVFSSEALILFEQMQLHPKFTSEVLRQAKRLSKSIAVEA